MKLEDKLAIVAIGAIVLVGVLACGLDILEAIQLGL